MHPRATELITTLGLQPHPEGGFYRQIFRSWFRSTRWDRRGPRAALNDDLLPPPGGDLQPLASGASDEVWHLYEGGPLELLELSASGQSVLRHRLPQSAAAQTHRFARSLPGFGKQRGAGPLTRSSAVQLAPGSTSRIFVCSQTIMYGLLPSERHWPDLERSLISEALCCSISGDISA